MSLCSEEPCSSGVAEACGQYLRCARGTSVYEYDKLQTLKWLRRGMDRLSCAIPPDLPAEYLIGEGASGYGHRVQIAARIVAEIDDALRDTVSGQRLDGPCVPGRLSPG